MSLIQVYYNIEIVSFIAACAAGIIIWKKIVFGIKSLSTYKVNVRLGQSEQQSEFVFRRTLEPENFKNGTSKSSSCYFYAGNIWRTVLDFLCMCKLRKTFLDCNCNY